jgi:hypothetical protein
MKKLLMLGAGLALWLGYASAQICLAQQRTTTAATKNKTTAFVNVNVLPMDTERVLYGQTVIVRDGRIAEIGDAGKLKIPKNALRIDGRGKFLMPGFADMHAHLNSPHELPLYLASGVTTVYNLNGRPAHLLWRERIVKGEMLAPSIYTCGPTIRTAKTAEDARQIVEEQARSGYDSIKIYSFVSKEAYPVLIEEARKRKMLVVGHIPREPKFEDVMKSGMAIAHAEEFGYTFFNYNFDDYSRIAEAVKMTRENNVPVIPSLVAFDRIIRQAEDLPALLALPEMKYLAPWVRAEWQPGKNLYQQRFAGADGISGLKKSFALQRKLAQDFRRAGVRIMVGTDAMNMGVVPGFSVHEELRNLTEIGFTPFEALEAATRSPAEFLQSGEFGTVSAGRRADLILLEGNPLEDVSRAARPAGVMIRGRWLPGNVLRRMLDEVPAAYAREEQFVKTNFASDTARVLNYLGENDPFNNLLNEAVANLVAERGAGEFAKIFAKAKSINPGSNLVQEDFINALGYRLLGRNKPREAIEIFRFNTEAFPKSGNTYDSLAEAYLGTGEKKLAAAFYKKALEVEPNYPNAKTATEIVKKLEAELKTGSPK